MRQTPKNHPTTEPRPYGDGTLDELEPGLWLLRGSAGTGKARKQAKRQFAGTETAAKKALRALLDELEKKAAAATTPAAAAGTIEDLLERYCVDRERLERSPVTVAEYRRRAKRDVVPRIGDRPVGKFSKADVAAFYGELSRAGFGPVSIKRTHALLHGAFECAVAWELVAANPFHGAELARVVEPEVDPPTPDELVALLSKIEDSAPTLAAALALASRFGLRRGEVCALRWSDFDEKKAELRIDRAIISPKGTSWVEKSTKGGRKRRLPLSAADVDEITAHRLRCELAAHDAGVKLRPGGFMFPRETHPSGAVPMRPDFVTKKTNALTAGTLHPHAVRHFFATEIHEAGVSARVAGDLLGHADHGALFLRRYAHVREHQHAATAGIVGDILRKAAS